MITTFIWLNTIMLITNAVVTAIQSNLVMKAVRKDEK